MAMASEMLVFLARAAEAGVLVEATAPSTTTIYPSYYEGPIALEAASGGFDAVIQFSESGIYRNLRTIFTESVDAVEIPVADESLNRITRTPLDSRIREQLAGQTTAQLMLEVIDVRFSGVNEVRIDLRGRAALGVLRRVIEVRYEVPIPRGIEFFSVAQLDSIGIQLTAPWRAQVSPTQLGVNVTVDLTAVRVTGIESDSSDFRRLVVDPAIEQLAVELRARRAVNLIPPVSIVGTPPTSAVIIPVHAIEVVVARSGFSQALAICWQFNPTRAVRVSAVRPIVYSHDYAALHSTGSVQVLVPALWGSSIIQEFRANVPAEGTPAGSMPRRVTVPLVARFERPEMVRCGLDPSTRSGALFLDGHGSISWEEVINADGSRERVRPETRNFPYALAINPAPETTWSSDTAMVGLQEISSSIFELLMRPFNRFTTIRPRVVDIQIDGLTGMAWFAGQLR